MFDVIRVAQKDRDLYDWLQKTVCCTGYFQIRMQDDPREETTIFHHVIDGSPAPVGRNAVLKSLVDGGWMKPEYGPPPFKAMSGFGDFTVGTGLKIAALGAIVWFLWL